MLSRCNLIELLLVAKSGVRVEWLNSFIYFAETGMKLEQGTGRLLSTVHKIWL